MPFGYFEFSRAKRRELCTYVRARARRRWRRPAGRYRAGRGRGLGLGLGLECRSRLKQNKNLVDGLFKDNVAVVDKKFMYLYLKLINKEKSSVYLLESPILWHARLGHVNYKSLKKTCLI